MAAGVGGVGGRGGEDGPPIVINAEIMRAALDFFEPNGLRLRFRPRYPMDDETANENFGNLISQMTNFRPLFFDDKCSLLYSLLQLRFSDLDAPEGAHGVERHSSITYLGLWGRVIQDTLELAEANRLRNRNRESSNNFNDTNRDRNSTDKVIVKSTFHDKMSQLYAILWLVIYNKTEIEDTLLNNIPPLKRAKIRGIQKQMKEIKLELVNMIGIPPSYDSEEYKVYCNSPEFLEFTRRSESHAIDLRKMLSGINITIDVSCDFEFNCAGYGFVKCADEAILKVSCLSAFAKLRFVENAFQIVTIYPQLAEREALRRRDSTYIKTSDVGGANMYLPSLMILPLVRNDSAYLKLMEKICHNHGSTAYSAWSKIVKAYNVLSNPNDQSSPEQRARLENDARDLINFACNFEKTDVFGKLALFVIEKLDEIIEGLIIA